MQSIDENLVSRIAGQHAKGAKVLLRRTHEGGHVKVQHGPFRLMTERHKVNVETLDVLLAMLRGENDNQA